MASRKNTASNKEAETSLEEQMAQFLAKGGKVQQIPLGVSGQVATTGPRHITLGKRNQSSS